VVILVKNHRLELTLQTVVLGTITVMEMLLFLPVLEKLTMMEQCIQMLGEVKLVHTEMVDMLLETIMLSQIQLLVEVEMMVLVVLELVEAVVVKLHGMHM
jgi:hypothetical protein